MPILLTNATLATMTQGYGLIEGGSLVVEGDMIAFAGPMSALPTAFAALAPQDFFRSRRTES